MSNLIFSIEYININSDEVIDNPETFNVKRSINTKPQEEYQIGRNKNFYPLNIRSNKNIYKYEISLLLDRNKMLGVENIYKDQLYNKIYNYVISNSYDTVFLTFDSPYTYGMSKCVIESFEITGSVIREDIVLYKCDLTLIEILI